MMINIMYSSFFACFYSLPDHPGAPVHGVSYYDCVDCVGYFRSPSSSYIKSQLWGILCDDRNDVQWDYRDGICLQWLEIVR